MSPYTVLCDFERRFVNAVGHVCGFVCSYILSDSSEIFSVTISAGFSMKLLCVELFGQGRHRTSGFCSGLLSSDSLTLPSEV